MNVDDLIMDAAFDGYLLTEEQAAQVIEHFEEDEVRYAEWRSADSDWTIFGASSLQ